MPHLIHVSRFHDRTSFGSTRYGTYDPREFFIDASYDGYNSRWSFNVINTYPHTAYAHIQTLEELDGGFFVDMRRFVERKATGDVIYSENHMGYRWCWNEKEAKGDWDRKYSDVSHGYWVFNFENHEDLMMWSLMKPGLMQAGMSRFHPDYDYHNESNTMRR